MPRPRLRLSTALLLFVVVAQAVALWLSAADAARLRGYAPDAEKIQDRNFWMRAKMDFMRLELDRIL